MSAVIDRVGSTYFDRLLEFAMANPGATIRDAQRRVPRPDDDPNLFEDFSDVGTRFHRGRRTSARTLPADLYSDDLPQYLLLPRATGTGLTLSVLGSRSIHLLPTMGLALSVREFARRSFLVKGHTGRIEITDVALGSGHFRISPDKVAENVLADWIANIIPMMIVALLGFSVSSSTNDVRKSCRRLVNDDGFAGIACEGPKGELIYLSPETLKRSAERGDRLQAEISGKRDRNRDKASGKMNFVSGAYLYRNGPWLRTPSDGLVRIKDARVLPSFDFQEGVSYDLTGEWDDAQEAFLVFDARVMDSPHRY